MFPNSSMSTAVNWKSISPLLGVQLLTFPLMMNLKGPTSLSRAQYCCCSWITKSSFTGMYWNRRLLVDVLNNNRHVPSMSDAG